MTTNGSNGSRLFPVTKSAPEHVIRNEAKVTAPTTVVGSGSGGGGGAGGGDAKSVAPVLVMSPIDCMQTRAYTNTMFVYRDTLDVNRLRSSLTIVLNYYPMLCGSLRNRVSEGGFEVALTDRGLLWITAKCDTPYPERSEFEADTIPIPTGNPSGSLTRDLLPNPVPLASSDAEGVMYPAAVQITQFAGGVSVLCFSVWHAVMDGVATFKFLNHWAHIARTSSGSGGGGSGSVAVAAKSDFPLPIHDRTLIAPVTLDPASGLSATALATAAQSFAPTEYKLVPKAAPPPAAPTASTAVAAPTYKTPAIVARLFHFTEAELNAIKLAASPTTSSSVTATTGSDTKSTTAGGDVKQTSGFVSTNDAICAHVWKCLTRARIHIRASDGGSGGVASTALLGRTSTMAMACDGRARIKPKLTDSYCGNGHFYITASVDVLQLAGTDTKGLCSLASTIRAAVNGFTSERLRLTIGWIAALKSYLDATFSFWVNGSVRFTQRISAAAAATAAGSEQPVGGTLCDDTVSLQPFYSFDVGFTNWSKMNMYIDFGFGAPEYAGFPNTGVDGFVLLSETPPTIDSTKRSIPGTGLYVYIGLLEPHMKQLISDPLFRQYRNTSSVAAAKK